MDQGKVHALLVCAIKFKSQIKNDEAGLHDDKRLSW